MSITAARAALAAGLRDPLAWASVTLTLLVVGMSDLKPLFAAAFPALDRPMYEQDSFGALLIEHLRIVGLSSGAAMLVGFPAGILVTRSAGREFRPLLESVVAMGQAVPPVAVLAIAVPLIGFGAMPALVALGLYSLLPIVHSTIAGIESVPGEVRLAAEGMGLHRWQKLWLVELPLALPVLLAGVRTSVTVNIGTAAIASTVGVKTLGTPIIVGLNGFNMAYVLQGALIAGLLAIVVDMFFDRIGRYLGRWRA
jgi:osmoprotectant transport system permease protein